MAESGGKEIGRDTSQGPGWWLASDEKWYPPELSPGNQARKKKRKKKKKKKKAPAPRATSAAGDPATPAAKGGAKARASSTHRGGRGAATKARESEDRPLGPPGDEFVEVGGTPDQIAARRIQAREQNVLLAGPRQQAALRALTSLGVDAEPELVSAGVRSFDAPGRGPTRPPEAPSPPPSEPATRDIDPEPPPAAPDSPSDADADIDAGTTDEPVEVDTEDLADEPETVPAPHRPTKRPEPVSAPMGTEAPFMEVRGSALGTDIERIGEKILIFADRVELRDRGNTVKQTITYDELARVAIPKKIMGPSLVVTSVDGDEMMAKALRPELATGAKAMIEKHARRHLGTEDTDTRADTEDVDTAPEPPEVESPDAARAGAPEPDVVEARAMPAVTPAPPAVAAEPEPEPEPTPALVASPDRAPTSRRMPARHVLAAMIDELHEAGLLTDDERTEKLAHLEIIGHD